MRNDVSSTKEIFFAHEIETIFIEIVLSKTKPLAVCVIYCPPSQTRRKFLINLIPSKKETYTLGDFNINLYLNNKYIFGKYWTPVSSIIS